MEWARRWSTRSDSEPSQSDDITFEKAPAFDRPGKFESPSDFAHGFASDEEFLRRKYKKLDSIGAIPGWIVHVFDQNPEDKRSQDKSRRLDRRVMLILRESNMSFMCFTFCWHDGPQKPQTHWRVFQKSNAERQAEVPAEDTAQKLLEVILQPRGISDDAAAPTIKPKDGVTINIDDPWNVEKEVYVKVLGRVAPSALPALAEAVKNLFYRNVDAAVPQPPDRNEARLPDRSKNRRDSKHGDSKYADSKYGESQYGDLKRRNSKPRAGYYEGRTSKEFWK